jgi:5-methyltetrahydrofolate--homocysteine methyltransferase
MTHPFLSRLKNEILVFDGAMGTLLQASGLPRGACPDEWNLSHPEKVRDCHRAYFAAGADAVQTNTFGATRTRLKDYGLQDQVEEINVRGARMAREASVGAHGRAPLLVAGSIGPSGMFLQPFGELSFEAAYDIFKEQALALVKGGVDLLIIETMVDLQEMRAALLAARDVSPVPIIAQMSFTKDSRTVTGTDPVTALSVLSAMGADVVGANCMIGPAEMLPVFERLASTTDHPLSAQPNAGMPQLVGPGGDETVFPGTPEEIAEYGEKYVLAGANIVGSCCGTSPEHTKALAQRVKHLKPIQRKHLPGTRLASRVKTVFAGTGYPFVAIGERINPSGRKLLTREIEEGKSGLLRRDAQAQAQAGATVLDINVGIAGGDLSEPRYMRSAIEAVQNVVDSPMAIDTTGPEALTAGLKTCVGKPLVNSISGEEARMDLLMPLVRRFGAAFIGLALDERGIPATARDRLKVAERILAKAGEHGIRPEDIVIDPLVLTVSTNQDDSGVTLETIALVKRHLGLTTSFGLSNVSFGLPGRKHVNQAYLVQALSYGLDMAIVNPLDETLMALVRAGDVLAGRDRNARVYIETFKAEGPGEASAAKPQTTGPQSPETVLFNAILEGDRNAVPDVLVEILKKGAPPLQVINETMIPAIRQVGEAFDQGSLFLPQLMLSAEAMKVAFGILRPLIQSVAPNAKGEGTILMATVQGDVHDIGKNLVIAVLESHGYRVADLGKNVPAEKIIAKARETDADIVGLSALMTTTMGEMRQVAKTMREEGLRARLMIGGAPVTEKFAREIGAQAYGRDAMDAVRVVRSLLGKDASKIEK